MGGETGEYRIQEVKWRGEKEGSQGDGKKTQSLSDGMQGALCTTAALGPGLTRGAGWNKV